VRPKVSVLTTTYNRRALLQRCIDSVLRQHYAPLEVVILDDGSTDGTPEDWARTSDPRVRYLYQSHRGLDYLADLANDLLKEATGQYVAWLDSDDWYIDPEVIGDLVTLLETHDGAMAFAGSPARRLDGQVEWDGVFAVGWYNRLGLPAWDHRRFFRELLARNLISASAVMLRTDVLRSVGGFRTFPGLPAQDYATWLELTLTHAWFYLPRNVSYRHVHPHQATRLRGVDLAEGAYALAEHYFARGLEAGIVAPQDWPPIARRRKRHLADARWADATALIRERRWDEADALVAKLLASHPGLMRRAEAWAARLSVRRRRDLVSGPLSLAGRIGLRF